MSYFAFVGVAFGARLTVPTSVAFWANEKIIAKPKENTGKPKKAKKPTVWLKIAVDTA